MEKSTFRLINSVDISIDERSLRDDMYYFFLENTGNKRDPVWLEWSTFTSDMCELSDSIPGQVIAIERSDTDLPDSVYLFKDGDYEIFESEEYFRTDCKNCHGCNTEDSEASIAYKRTSKPLLVAMRRCYDCGHAELIRWRS